MAWPEFIASAIGAGIAIRWAAQGVGAVFAFFVALVRSI